MTDRYNHYRKKEGLRLQYNTMTISMVLIPTHSFIKWSFITLMYFTFRFDLHPTAGIAQCRQRRIEADPVNRSRGSSPGATVLEDSGMSQVVTKHGFESMRVLEYLSNQTNINIHTYIYIHIFTMLCHYVWLLISNYHFGVIAACSFALDIYCICLVIHIHSDIVEHNLVGNKHNQPPAEMTIQVFGWWDSEVAARMKIDRWSETRNK